MLLLAWLRHRVRAVKQENGNLLVGLPTNASSAQKPESDSA